jgi:hypothetical protein
LQNCRFSVGIRSYFESLRGHYKPFSILGLTKSENQASIPGKSTRKKGDEKEAGI